MKKKIFKFGAIILAVSFLLGGCGEEGKFVENRGKILEEGSLDEKEYQLLYTYNVEIRADKDNEEYFIVNFAVDIIPKDKKVYSDVEAVAELPEEIFEDIAVQTYNSFGTAMKAEIDLKDKDKQGIGIVRSTLIEKDKDIKAFVKKIKNNRIKVKVTWNGGQEVVSILPKKVKVEKGIIK